VTGSDAFDIPGLDAAARGILAERSRAVTAPAGTVIFSPGETCETLVLLSSGSVQVRTISEDGRELLLYRVLPGEACVMSVACLLGGTAFQAEAVAECEVRGHAIGRATFLELLASSAAFRDRVLAVQTARIYDLVGLVDDLAFRDTAQRLAHRLIELAAGADDVEVTHQQLALDIGTAREVVSRRLKLLEGRGVLAVERRHIRILDPQRLAELAHGSAAVRGRERP
jgi:CRP/FNR family transcriptional regulator